ncbi:unnamed protein product [Clonostachys rhizophaga]|uniref:Uncharacterized protein n=1 Tax=Clonostachys rhizophaga TaxID=160324 RepID=A0A9N9YI64_9HYPO|nr:unnamed protein product [Clonostachys rhizophaga]
MADSKTKPPVICVLHNEMLEEYVRIMAPSADMDSCGSSSGTNPVHLQAARDLAAELHKNNAQLVYGGGTFGLMGELAKTLVSLSGPDAVYGYVPQGMVQLDKGRQGSKVITSSVTGKIERVIVDEQTMDPEFGRVLLVPDLHTRKKAMAQKVLEGGPGSGFIALAGGFGTLEEVLEIATWYQMKIHRQGVVLLNINNYWDHVVAWVKNSTEEGFLSRAGAGIIMDTTDVQSALGLLRDFEKNPPAF